MIYPIYYTKNYKGKIIQWTGDNFDEIKSMDRYAFLTDSGELLVTVGSLTNLDQTTVCSIGNYIVQDVDKRMQWITTKEDFEKNFTTTPLLTFDPNPSATTIVNPQIVSNKRDELFKELIQICDNRQEEKQVTFKDLKAFIQIIKDSDWYSSTIS